MIYQAPDLTKADQQVLQATSELRRALRFSLHQPRRWYGTLRRAAFARAVQGSNSIEGYHAGDEDVAAVIEEEEPLETNEETRQAIAGYRDAMTYVMQLAKADHRIDRSTLLGLHFMIMKYQLDKNPGRWRPGAVWIEDRDGHVVYTAPGREMVEALVDKTLENIHHAVGPVMVTAAMAHLNLVMIHPWSDGNGRMARCLQTLVLASEGILDPVFCSIEEYLGRNTPSYYQALGAVHDGEWAPERGTRSWIEFSPDRPLPTGPHPAAPHRAIRGSLESMRESRRLPQTARQSGRRPVRCCPTTHPVALTIRQNHPLLDGQRDQRYDRNP